MREVNILGLLMPGLIPLFFVCLAVVWRLDKFLARRKLYAWTMHPPAFRVALFVALFSLAGLLMYW